MTRKEILLEEFGQEAYERFSPSFKALIAKLDALPPVGKRGLLRPRKRIAA